MYFFYDALNYEIITHNILHNEEKRFMIFLEIKIKTFFKNNFDYNIYNHIETYLY